MGSERSVPRPRYDPYLYLCQGRKVLESTLFSLSPSNPCGTPILTQLFSGVVPRCTSKTLIQSEAEDRGETISSYFLVEGYPDDITTGCIFRESDRGPSRSISNREFLVTYRWTRGTSLCVHVSVSVCRSL